jgi:hypothetical protein
MVKGYVTLTTPPLGGGKRHVRTRSSKQSSRGGCSEFNAVASVTWPFDPMTHCTLNRRRSATSNRE